MVKIAVGYVLRCYHSRDPNFNLEVIREGVVADDLEAEAKLEAKCQGPLEFIGSLFWVETEEE